MKVKNYTNFSSVLESKNNEIEGNPNYGEVCVLLDALEVPCEISKIDEKIQDKRIEVTLKNGVIMEILKSNKGELFSTMKIYQNDTDPTPCLIFKNSSNTGLLIFDFESDGIPEISEEINFSDFLSNDILRNFLLKKSFKLLGQKDLLDLKSHYDDLLYNGLDPSSDGDNLIKKRFLNTLSSFLTPSEIEVYRNL